MSVFIHFVDDVVTAQPCVFPVHEELTLLSAAGARLLDDVELGHVTPRPAVVTDQSELSGRQSEHVFAFAPTAVKVFCEVNHVSRQRWGVIVFYSFSPPPALAGDGVTLPSIIGSRHDHHSSSVVRCILQELFDFPANLSQLLVTQVELHDFALGWESATDRPLTGASPDNVNGEELRVHVSPRGWC